MIDTKVLSRQILLSEIDKEEIEKISRVIKKVSLRQGEQIFKEKDDTRGLYLVWSGKVEISKVTPDGLKYTLAVLTTGQFFGELSILEKRVHEASAVAVEDTELFLIQKGDFEELMKEGVALACEITKKIAYVMSKNIRRMNDRFLGALVSY
jgi:CRP-like cAMP-binding protein